MEPNDLPIVCLPLDLSDESVASLIEFLHELIEALERHYAGQLLRLDHQHEQPPAMAPSAHLSDVEPSGATASSVRGNELGDGRDLDMNA